MKDQPYSTLKEDKRRYEILLLHDQEGKRFSEIADIYHISSNRVHSLYYKIKYQQFHLYSDHIAAALGESAGMQIKKEVWDAYECYRDIIYVCTWLEKNYADILTAYRAGEPGLPAQVIRALPPLRTALRNKTVARVVALREEKHASYKAIAKELRMTPEKARYTYEVFYHEKALKILKGLEAKAKSETERREIRKRYLYQYRSAKKAYEALLQDHIL